MKTAMNVMVAAALVVGSTGAAFASEGATDESVAAMAPTASAESTSGDVSAPADTNEGTGATAYCYWETYCNVYGYCWTSWVCF